jgi:predicted NBD/HSP70 family sugar kinase
VKVDSELLCECGATGCLEAIASDLGICFQIARQRDLPAISIEDALTLAQTGDQAAQATFEQAGRALGRCIGNLLNLFNPQLVIVTGEGVRSGSLLLGPMHQEIRAASFDLLAEDTRIEVQSWGDEAWAQGAASIVVHEMLRPPIYESGATGPLTHLLDRRARSSVRLK